MIRDPSELDIPALHDYWARRLRVLRGERRARDPRREHFDRMLSDSLGIGLEQASLDDFLPMFDGRAIDWAKAPGPVGRAPLECAAQAIEQRHGLRRASVLHVSACAAGTLALAHAAALIALVASAAEAIEVGVVQGQPPRVRGQDHEGRARDLVRVDTQAAGQAPDERGLAAPELAEEEHDLASAQRRAEVRT